jgi:hypothetical protein
MASTPIAVYELAPTWLDYLAGQDPAVRNGYLGQPNLSVVARKTGFTQVYVWRVAHGLAAPNLCFMASLVAACDTHEDDARHALFSLRRIREERDAADAGSSSLAELGRRPAGNRSLRRIRDNRAAADIEITSLIEPRRGPAADRT